MNNKIILSLLIPSMIYGCTETRVVDIDNVVWKADRFDLVITSTQLQNSCYGYEGTIEKEELYSSIVVLDEKYFCDVCLENAGFAVYLLDENEKFYTFYGQDQDFLWGSYIRPKKVDEEYSYILNIELTKSGQWYEYCVDHDIEFPNTLTLYGYYEEQ